MANKYTAEQLKLTAPSGGFKQGGWYQGRQYWNGTFSDPNVIHPESNQQGAGTAVSQEVKTASATAQGVSVTDFNDYLNNLSVKNLQPSVSVPLTSNNSATSGYVSGLTDTVISARQALDQEIATRRSETQVKLKEAKATETGALQKIGELTTPFRETLEKTERERLGIEKVLSDQKSLLDELDTLLTEGNALIKQQQEVTGLSAIRNPRIQQTMDDISARAGVINAVVSLQNTYLANAYTAIDRSVSAITEDRRDQLNYYDTILNLANRDIVTLSAEDKALAEEQTNLLKTDLDNAQKTSDYVKSLMINPDTALAMAQSGVSLNDSVETINTKLSNYQYSKEVKDAANIFTSAGGVLVTNPSSVPANQLKSFTDSRGKTYYYKMPKTGTTQVTNTAADWLKENIKTTETSTFTDNTKTTTEKTPQFSPSGGVGTVYVNPTTGSIWQYTNSGWSKIT